MLDTSTNTSELLDKGHVYMFGLKHKIGLHGFVYYYDAPSEEWVNSSKDPSMVREAIVSARQRNINALTTSLKEETKKLQEYVQNQIGVD